MKRRLLFSLCAAVFAVALIPAAARSQSPDSSASPTQVIASAAPHETPVAKPIYARDIAPLFEQHCVSCHSGAKPSGDLVLKFKDADEVKQKASSDKEFWSRVVGMLSSKEMPPEDATTKLSEAERS